MWVARDKEGNLMFWDCSEKPKRVCDSTWACDNHRGVGYLDSSLFPELKWEDDPIEVELTKVNRHYTQCNKCGKAFSYLPKDVEIVSVCLQPSSGYEDDFEVVKCPHCKSDVYL